MQKEYSRNFKTVILNNVYFLHISTRNICKDFHN